MTNAQPAVTFEPLFQDSRVPSRATHHAAGYDLHVYLKGRQISIRRRDGRESSHECPARDDASVRLRGGEMALLPLGFKARLPAGYEAQIRMRSSWAFRQGLLLPNAPGTIDADYPDEWMVMVLASRDGETSIVHGDRVAQAVLARYDVLPWVEGNVAATTDRVGGLGSTG
jgi:dUTP diphosphatase